MNKEILFSWELSEKIFEGVNVVADAVTSTLWPRGTNVIFQEWGYYVITKDWVTVAQNVSIEDKFKNMGVMIAREAAESTNKKAGDGTTSTIAILRDVIKEGNKYIAAWLNPVLVKRGILSASEIVVKELNKSKKELKTLEEKLNIATISSNNDKELGKLIVDVIEKVGKNWVITVTNGNTKDNEVEYINGMKINARYADQIFINNQRKLTCDSEEPLIVITNDRINQQSQLVPMMTKLFETGKKEMVLFAEEIEWQALAFIIQNFLQWKFICYPVKIPQMTWYNEDVAQDLASLVWANIVWDDKIRTLAKIELEDFGQCDSAIIGKESVIVTWGEGDIAERVENIETLIKEEKDSFNIEKLKDRLGRVNGKIANIKVWGFSSTEQLEIKYRIEDALNATKHAIEDGIVEWAGTALLRISELINTDSEVPEIKAWFDIVKKSICAPFKKIINNWWENAEAIMWKVLESSKWYNSLTNSYWDLFEEWVIDPKLVVENEVINACSTASTLLTSSVGIINKEDKK